MHRYFFPIHSLSQIIRHTKLSKVGTIQKIMWFTFYKKEYWALSIRNVLPIFEDGKGNVIDRDGHELVQMELDKEAYLLDNITDFDTHL